MEATWVPCSSCEEYWCVAHKKHVSDCECPPLEEWKDSPYG